MFDFFFSSGSVLRDLHSFPTRRSSDLFVAVLLGFLVSTASHLSTDIEKLIGSSSDLTEKIVAETDAIEPLIGNKTFPEAGAGQQKAIALIQNQLQEQNYLLDQMLQKTQVMRGLITLGL